MESILTSSEKHTGRQMLAFVSYLSGGGSIGKPSKSFRGAASIARTNIRFA
jgi:hypothetical protein